MKHLFKFALLALLLISLIGAVQAATTLSQYNANRLILAHMNGTNDGTIFTDEMGNTFTRFGDTKTVTAIKKLGNASGYFDGAGDYLTIPQGTFPDGQYTIMFWINKTVDDGANEMVMSIGDHVAGGNWWEILYYKSGTVGLRLYKDGAYKYAIVNATATTQSVFHQVVAQYNGTYANLWVDGAPATPAAYTWADDIPAGDINIFSGVSGGVRAYSGGHMDELAIWNTTIPISVLYPMYQQINSEQSTTFSVNATTGTAPAAILFADTSTFVPTSGQYNATNVTGNNVPFIILNTLSGTYTFTKEGNYSISLNATNAAGFDISDQVTWVNVSSGVQIPIVRWLIDKIQMRAPAVVMVNDTSLNSPTSYFYNWSDGQANSTFKNGTHVFGKIGGYNISHTAVNSAGSNTSYKLVRVMGYQGFELPEHPTIWDQFNLLFRQMVNLVHCIFSGTVCDNNQVIGGT